jgi:Raf kinase inhibitor-like YbhB/YbcL family protein
VSESTVELALAVVDPDAQNFVHWVIAGIDPGLSQLAVSEVPPGAVQANNDFGQPGWAGPQPPPGERHTYVFTLYALTEPSGITEGADGAAAIETLEALPGATAELRGEYEQP